MSTQANLGVDRTQFWRDYREWVKVVQAIALGRDSKYKIDHEMYRRLHRDLLQMCHQQMLRAHHGKAQLYKDLAATISPWVTVTALEESNRENLLEVLKRSERIQRQLRGVIFEPSRRFWYIMCLAAGLMTAFALSQLGIIDVGLDPADLAATIRNKSRRIVHMIQRSSAVQRWQIIGIITAILSIPLVIQWGRRY